MPEVINKKAASSPEWSTWIVSNGPKIYKVQKNGVINGLVGGVGYTKKE